MLHDHIKLFSEIDQQLVLCKWELMQGNCNKAQAILTQEEIEFLKLIKYKNKLVEEMEKCNADDGLFYKKIIETVKSNIDMLARRIEIMHEINDLQIV